MRWLYITVIVPLAVLIPISVAIIRRRQLLRQIKPVFFYLLAAGITNFFASMMALRRMNNMPLLHLYTVAELLLLAVFYRRVFDGKGRKIVNWLCILFTTVCIANACFFQSIYTNPTITRSLESVILSGLAIAWFFKLPPAGEVQAKHETLFLVNTALLLYFAGAFFLFMFARMLWYKPGDILIWRIHATLVLLMYLLFTAAFIRSKK
jgi:hypothetical protein